MKKHHVGSLAALAVSFVLGSPAGAQTSSGPAPTVPVVMEGTSVRLLLTAHHELPNREAFARASARAHLELAEIATGDRSLLHRNRALAALTYWPSDQTLAVYAGVLEDPSTPVATRHQVLMHASRMGEAAIEVVAPFLEAEDAQIRVSAVRSLAYIGGDRAQAVLAARASVERDEVVSEELSRAGRRLR